MAMDNFLEEVATRRNRGLETVMYMFANVMMVVFAILAFMHLMSIQSAMTQGAGFVDILLGAILPLLITGGIAVLRGNLAPLGAVVKPAAVPESMYVFCGRAVIFQSEQEACAKILAGCVRPGSVVVLRYEGPKGGPGMPEMYRPMKCLEGMKLSDTCALITDGRFSGSNRGLFVGHISPEASDAGPLALAENGDMIRIDIPQRELTLEVPEETLAERKKHWTIPDKEIQEGWLQIYRRISTSAAEGAVIL